MRPPTTKLGLRLLTPYALTSALSLHGPSRKQLSSRVFIGRCRIIPTPWEADLRLSTWVVSKFYISRESLLTWCVVEAKTLKYTAVDSTWRRGPSLTRASSKRAGRILLYSCLI